MNYTLDTDAVRKRFEQAIIGIRADGTMAVLVPTKFADEWLSLIDGASFYIPPVKYKPKAVDIFPTLIRPGDRVDGLFECGVYTGIYCGYSSNPAYPFAVDNRIFANIRPLPAAEPNPLLTRLTAAEQELAAIRAEMNQVQK